MTALELLEYAVPAAPSTSAEPSRRSIRKLLEPLFRRVAHASTHWRAESAGFWRVGEDRHWMPRLVFQRPGEQPTFKIGIFAGIHGDEPAGVHALCDLVPALEELSWMARQYTIHVYPLCNPTGYEDGTRHSRAGKDLNREFWRGSLESEVQILEREILEEKYDGFIALHSDDTSEGLYGFARGALLTKELLQPALAVAEEALPVNHSEIIDGFHAQQGIIHTAYDGILSAPPGTKPEPFEIILESPAHAPLHLQRASFVLALVEILRHYRRLIAYADGI